MSITSTKSTLAETPANVAPVANTTPADPDDARRDAANAIMEKDNAMKAAVTPPVIEKTAAQLAADNIASVQREIAESPEVKALREQITKMEAELAAARKAANDKVTSEFNRRTQTAWEIWEKEDLVFANIISKAMSDRAAHGLTNPRRHLAQVGLAQTQKAAGGATVTPEAGGFIGPDGKQWFRYSFGFSVDQRGLLDQDDRITISGDGKTALVEGRGNPQHSKIYANQVVKEVLGATHTFAVNGLSMAAA